MVGLPRVFGFDVIPSVKGSCVSRPGKAFVESNAFDKARFLTHVNRGFDSSGTSLHPQLRGGSQP
jgi:hypothetical protein